MSSTLTLYNTQRSSNALKVRFLLAELGLDATLVAVAIGAPTAEYLALHPFGTVPCLVDGDLVITESNTMLRDLAMHEGRTDLYPTDIRLRTRIDQVLDALSLQLRPLLWGVEEPLIYGDGVVSESARTALDLGLAAWERLLDANAEIFKSFTIADCAIAGRISETRQVLGSLAKWPRTQAILDRCDARPAFQTARG